MSTFSLLIRCMYRPILDKRKMAEQNDNELDLKKDHLAWDNHDEEEEEEESKVRKCWTTQDESARNGTELVNVTPWAAADTFHGDFQNHAVLDFARDHPVVDSPNSNAELKQMLTSDNEADETDEHPFVPKRLTTDEMMEKHEQSESMR
jgi:hypothetical protein